MRGPRILVALTFGVLIVPVLGAARSVRADYTVQLNGTTLQVSGDKKSDTLALRLDGTGTLLIVDVGNDGTADFTIDRSLFTAIAVSAGAGNDVVMVDESAGAFTDESIVLDGGPGRDTLIGGSGADVLIGGDGDDVVDPRRGNDTVLLGAGADTVLWDPGDGSDIIEGQEGEDRLEFHGANVGEAFELSANGARVLFTRNVGNIVMDLDGIEQLDLATLGGADVVTVNDLTGTDLVRMNVELDAVAGGGTGDGAADAVLVRGTAGADTVRVGAVEGALEVAGLAATVRVIGGEAALDRVEYDVGGPDEVDVVGTKKADDITIAPSPVAAAVRTSVAGFPLPVDVAGGGTLAVMGLGGNDVIMASTGLGGLGTRLVIDGGPGNDVITGGDGDDVLFGGRGNDTIRGGRGNDVVFLGTGSDTAIWDPGDGSDTIEGQQGGADTLQFHGANIGERFDVAANGGRVRFTRDIGNIVMDLDGIERIALTALGGADQVTVNDLTGTALKAVTVDLGAPAGGGDGAIDAVVVNGSAAPDKIKVSADAGGVSVARAAGSVRITNAEPTDSLTVNGLGGVDKIQVAPVVATAITLTVNPD